MQLQAELLGLDQFDDLRWRTGTVPVREPAVRATKFLLISARTGHGLRDFHYRDTWSASPETDLTVVRTAETAD
jgi:hypothetical protein